MKKLVLLFSICLSIKATAQNNAQKQPTTFNYVEQMPAPRVDVNKYIGQNMVYPDHARANNIEGRVILKFVIDTLGKIEDLHVIKSVDPSLDSEAVRVIRSMADWIPGQQNGRPVQAFMTLPIEFHLTDPMPRH